MWWRPRTDPSQAFEARLTALEAAVAGLRADMLEWEAGALQITQRLSRTLKSLAEMERRAALKVPDSKDPDQFDLEDEEDDLVTRMRRMTDGR